MSSDRTFSLMIDIKDVLNGIKIASTNLNNFITQAAQPVSVKFDNAPITQAIKDMQDQITKLQDQMGKMAEQTKDNITKTIGEIGFMLSTIKTGFSMAGGALSPLITASNQQEQATNSLRAALSTLGQATEANIQKYTRFASEMQNTANVGDETVLSMLSLATSMGILESKRMQAVQGAIGLSKVYGVDLQTALRGVALAQQGEYSMLQRYIPQLREASTETEKMKALQEAMASGFAIASSEASTGAGAILKLKNQFSDFQETLGDLIKNFIEPFVKALTSLFSFLNKYPALIKTIGVGIGILTTAIVANTIAIKLGIVAKYNSVKASLVEVATNAGLSASTVTLTATIWASVKAIVAQTAAFLASPIGWVVAGVGLVTGALAMFINSLFKSKKDTDDMSDAFQNMGDASTVATDKMLNNKQRLEADFKAGKAELQAELEKSLRLAETEHNRAIASFLLLLHSGKITREQYQELKAISERAFKQDMLNAARYFHDGVQALTKETTRDYRAEIDAIKASWLSAYEQIDLKAKEQKAKFDDIKDIDKSLHAEAMAAIDRQTNVEKQKQRLQDYKNSVDIARMKVDLEKSTHAEYQNTVEKYYDWVKARYGENTREHLDALKLVRDAEKETERIAEDEIKAQNEAAEAQKKALEDQKRLLEETIAIAEKRIQVTGRGYEELTEAADIYFTFMLSEYKNDELAYLNALEKRTQAHEAAVKAMTKDTATFAQRWQTMLEAVGEKFGAFASVANGAIEGIASSFGSAFADMLFEGKSFVKALGEAFKQFAKIAVAEIMRIIVQMMILKALGGVFTGGASVAVGVASGGYISGAGSDTSDSIPARLSNGEYVINARKTRIFRPLLDLINYSPLNSIQKTLNAYAAQVSFPDIPLTTHHSPLTMQRFATGGYVSGGANAASAIPTNILEALEYQMAQMVAGLDKLIQKDTNITINSKLKSIEYIREHNKMQDEYNKALGG